MVLAEERVGLSKVSARGCACVGQGDEPEAEIHFGSSCRISVKREVRSSGKCVHIPPPLLEGPENGAFLFCLAEIPLANFCLTSAIRADAASRNGCVRPSTRGLTLVGGSRHDASRAWGCADSRRGVGAGEVRLAVGLLAAAAGVLFACAPASAGISFAAATPVLARRRSSPRARASAQAPPLGARAGSRRREPRRPPRSE